MAADRAPSVLFLTADEVGRIQAGLGERFGGPAAIDDPGLLESALHRPRTGYYRDLAEMAAALFESLLMNRPFANLRLAFFATDVFLRLNGWRLRVDPQRAWGFLVGLLEEGRCDYEHLLPWIRRSLQPAGSTT